MISATQVRVGNIIKIDNTLYRVLKTQHITPGKGNAQIQADVRNIRNGIKINMRFRPSESIEKVDTDSVDLTFLYQDGDVFHFMNPVTYDQVEFHTPFVEDVLVYLKPEAVVTLLTCDGERISLSLPQRMLFTVTECDPPMRGIAGATKDATE